MRITIRVVTSSLLVLASIALIAGITSLFSTASPRSKEVAELWFKENKDELASIKSVLLDHPNIRRVEELDRLFLPGYGAFSEQDLVAYESILGKISELGIKSIDVARGKNDKDGDLIALEFLLESEGLTTGGHALSVEYIFQESYIQRAGKAGILMESLGLEGWYLVEYGAN